MASSESPFVTSLVQLVVGVGKINKAWKGLGRWLREEGTVAMALKSSLTLAYLSLPALSS